MVLYLSMVSLILENTGINRKGESRQHTVLSIQVHQFVPIVKILSSKHYLALAQYALILLQSLVFVSLKGMRHNSQW